MTMSSRSHSTSAVPGAHGEFAPQDNVLGKAAAILYCFGADDEQVPLAEVARRTGLAKTTAHRLLDQLTKIRLLDRDEAGYRLGGSLFELGLRASVERGLLEVAMPFLQDLYERTHETVHLAVREGTEVVYVEKIGGHRQAVVPSRIGGRLPLHCTAIGKALLATAPPEVLEELVTVGLTRLTRRSINAAGLLRQQLRKIAETGIAYEYEESAAGINCVAAPVLGPDGWSVAAISISGPIPRFRPEQHANSVRAAAAGIATTLARRAALRAAN